MRGEHLIIVVRVQEALIIAERDCLLPAHHQRVGKAAQQHHDAQDHVHDPDALVIDRGEPLLPEIAPQLELGDERQHREATNGDTHEGADDDGLVDR